MKVSTRMHGFTLVELLVSLVIFGLVMTVIAACFTTIYAQWKEQREVLELLVNSRWAMERFTKDIRRAQSSSLVTEKNVGNGQEKRLYFTSPDTPSGSFIYYWRENSSLYRAVADHWGGGSGGAQTLRVELADHVLDYPGNKDCPFECSDGDCAVSRSMELSLGTSDRNITLRTRARPRN